jgi:uncharacterized membrane protein (UPF0182 family)
VLLGNNLMVPLDQSVLYIRPLYVTSTSNPLPQLRYVIAVFNQQVGIEPTLAGALSDVLGANFTQGRPGTGTGSGPTGQSATADLQQASSAYSLAQKALSAGNLGAYQAEVNSMNRYLSLAQKALTGHSTASNVASTTTTTTTPKKKG